MPDRVTVNFDCGIEVLPTHTFFGVSWTIKAVWAEFGRRGSTAMLPSPDTLTLSFDSVVKGYAYPQF